MTKRARSDETLEAARAAALELHARYQVEFVEKKNVCPFARRSREQGRVHRPVYFPAHEDASAQRVAAQLADLVSRHEDAEIVLLTFVVGPAHAFAKAPGFEAYLADLRDAWEQLPAPAPWYMVSFHPRPTHDPGRAVTRDSLVPLLRRSPDPIIQCVNATVLDRVRREAQAVAHERMMQELRAKSPELAELFSRSIQADPELGAEIAQANFDRLGTGLGREELERSLAELRRAREEAYAPFPSLDLV